MSLSLDELLKEQGTPREFDNPGHARAEEPLPGSEPFYSPEDMAGEPDEAQPGSETSARAQARMASRLLDGLIGNGLAAYAKDKDSAAYRATPAELRDLEEDWVEVTRLHPLPIRPEWKLLITYLGTYWKYFDHARYNKEINEMKRRQEAQEARIRKLEDEQPKA